MAKIKTKWICQECGYETAGYLGKCPECGSWGSLVEEIQQGAVQITSVSEFLNMQKPSLINEIELSKEMRITTNISEFDNIFWFCNMNLPITEHIFNKVT